MLVKLVLTLPITTAMVERSFSAMKYIKNEMRNRMGDQWMNGCLVVYIERDVAYNIDNENYHATILKYEISWLCICMFFDCCCCQYTKFSFY